MNEIRGHLSLRGSCTRMATWMSSVRRDPFARKAARRKRTRAAGPFLFTRHRYGRRLTVRRGARLCRRAPMPAPDPGRSSRPSVGGRPAAPPVSCVQGGDHERGQTRAGDRDRRALARGRRRTGDGDRRRWPRAADDGSRSHQERAEEPARTNVGGRGHARDRVDGRSRHARDVHRASSVGVTVTCTCSSETRRAQGTVGLNDE